MPLHIHMKKMMSEAQRRLTLTTQLQLLVSSMFGMREGETGLCMAWYAKANQIHYRWFLWTKKYNTCIPLCWYEMLLGCDFRLRIHNTITPHHLARWQVRITPNNEYEEWNNKLPIDQTKSELADNRYIFLKSAPVGGFANLCCTQNIVQYQFSKTKSIRFGQFKIWKRSPKHQNMRACMNSPLTDATVDSLPLLIFIVSGNALRILCVIHRMWVFTEETPQHNLQ